MWDFACFAVSVAAAVAAGAWVHTHGGLFRDDPIRLPPHPRREPRPPSPPRMALH